MSIARFDGVAKWYGRVIGLVDVSLELPAGVIGLLGPNGAGKSTFLKLLTGQLFPSQGKVEVLGCDPFRTPSIYRRLGFCPEQDAFYESMRGRDFVRYLGAYQGLSGGTLTRAVDAALERVGLVEESKRRIRTYSKGMRQRIKLAQAIVHDPELLVLDEPLTGMDPVGRRKTIDLMAELGAEGRTVLVSSHVLHEVESMTREVVLIYQGRVRAHGTVSEIRSYLDRYPYRMLVRSPQARDLARALLALDSVTGVSLEGDRIHLTTLKPDELCAALPSLVLDRDFVIEEFDAEDASLDAIFEYLVG
ncbi:MAG: ABC transporter ATP-binding protein [Planctomycetota bacterium]